MRTLVGVLCVILSAGSAWAAGTKTSSPGGVPAATGSRAAGSGEGAIQVAARPPGTKAKATKTRKGSKPAGTSRTGSAAKAAGGSRKTPTGKSRAAGKPSGVQGPLSRPRTPAVNGGRLWLASGAALVVDQARQEVLYEKNPHARLPIASVTKLMTAMVVLDAGLPLDEEVKVNEEDVDWLKGSRSRLPLGTSLSRHELLYLALVASENRAASALARSYPGGKPAFVAAMNRKAEALGMHDTHFADPTGLFPANTSTAEDLVRMLRAAYGYPIIRQITTTPSYTLSLPEDAGSLDYRNTNRLVRAQTWDIGLSKTGYIQEAGRCLVMQADLADRPLLIVLLKGEGRATPFEDVARLRAWLARQPATSEASLAHTAG